MQKFKPSIPHLVSVQEPIQNGFLILHLCACLQQLFRAHIHLALSKRRVDKLSDASAAASLLTVLLEQNLSDGQQALLSPILR